MSKDKRLGRGLAALLGNGSDEMGGSQEIGDLQLHDPDHSVKPDETAAASTPRRGKSEIVLLDVHEVEPNPFQPRRDFSPSEIESLAESLKEHDQLQPILVRQVEGRWQLISGERRWRAAIKAGLSHIQAQVRDADDRLVAELAIVENLQRKDLNAVEKALSFKRYLDEHHCTQEDLGKRLKIDRSTIANLLRLLELPGEVQESIRKSIISAGHARALLPLGDEQAQLEFCQRIQREGLSVRNTERLVQEKIAQEDTEPLAVAGSTSENKRTPNQQVASLEQELRHALGTKIDIHKGSRGRGRIVIHFNGHEEFERIRSYLLDGDCDDLATGVG